MDRDPAADSEREREQVRRHYAAAATSARPAEAESGCCGPGAPRFGAVLYADRERTGLPQAAVRASLGCGNPTAVAELRRGEVVLDLGSGAGVDLLLSARRVGEAGKVYGLDMTEEMLALARDNIREAGVDNVELLEGFIEAIPLPAATVDVVISNCVVNLSSDKAAVFAEVHRVLRPGGRVGIADVLAADDLTAADRVARGSHDECVAGALSEREYRQLLGAAGFEAVAITLTHAVADGMAAGIVRARKPVTGGG